MTIPTFKYSNLSLSVKPKDGGFVLSSPGKDGRVFFVTAEGVHECLRDGSEKPVALIDCNPNLLARVAKALAASNAAAEKAAS